METQQHPLTTDDWSDKYMPQLRENIETNCTAASPEDLGRMHTIMVRQWAKPKIDVLERLIAKYGNYKGLKELEEIVRDAKRALKEES